MIGLTDTIPLEILIAANRQPQNLQRLFLSAGHPQGLIEEAEIAGFRSNGDPLIKGVYASVLRHGVREVVMTTSANPLQAKALAEMLQLHDVRTIPFCFPSDRSADSLALEIKKLARHFQASPVEINQARIRLNSIREKVHEIDRLAWQENKVSGSELQHYQLATGDMEGDPTRFEKDVELFLKKLGKRQPRKETVRLAWLGLPPLMSNLHETLEEFGGRVVYNEIPHQISMPSLLDSLVEQYRNYTPAYDIQTRLAAIVPQLDQRRVDAVIYGNTDDNASRVEELILRQKLKLPLLSLDVQRLGAVDTLDRLALAEFIGRLHDSK